MKKLSFLLILILFAQFSFANVIDEFQFAKEMYEDTLYEEAIKKFEEIIQQYPTSSEAEESQFYVGNAYIALQKYDKAIGTFQHLIKAYPDSKLIPNTMYQLAESQFKNEDYENAAKSYQQLINNFPQSDFSILSLQKVIKSYQLSGQNSQAILVANNIIKHYSDKSQIPKIYLLLAELYSENNMQEYFELTIEKIITDFSNSDAKWIAIEKLAKYHHSNNRTEKSLKIIEENLTELIPREFEKNLILLYANILFENENFNLAKENYQTYFRKYDMEKNLDEVAYKIVLTNFELEDFDEVMQNCSDFQIEFPESKFSVQIKILMAKNYLKLKKYNKSLQKIDEIKFDKLSEKIQYQILMLQIEIFEQQNSFEKAIANYLTLSRKYEKFAKTDSCYFRIAQIYQKNLSEYSTATKYYQMILNTFPQSKLRQQIQIEMAECYQKIGQYENSLRMLQNLVDKGNLSNNIESEILQKIQYIQKYQMKNQDEAFEKLMNCFIQYLTKKDENLALISIIKIYKEDLKEFEKAIEIFEQNPKLESNSEFLLLKGETYQDFAKKIEYRDNQTSENYFNEAKKTFQKLIQNFPKSTELTYAEYYLIDLNLRKFDKLSEEYIIKLKEYSTEFINNHSTFHKIGNVYFKLANALIHSNGDEQQIIQNLNQAIALSSDENITNSAHILLGNIYLKNKSYNAALNQYRDIDKEIIFGNGNFLFNYGLTQMHSNHLKKSLECFKFFVNNFEQNNNFMDGIKNLAYIFEKLNQTENAIYYYEFFALDNLDDALCRTLRKLYQNTFEYEKAIEISLKIEKFTNDDKRILAGIYLENEEIKNAIFQLEKVIENEDNKNQKLQDIEKLAKVNFDLNYYQAAIDNYKKILKLTSENKNRFSEIQFLNWNIIAENLIISYYRIKSRSQAEDSEDEFKHLLKGKLDILSHLLLERGIYYSNLDFDKTNKFFDEIIENYSDTKYADDAFFQQGLLALKNNNFDLAIEKFTKLIEKYPKSELCNNANLKLGSINFSNGNYKKALEYYQFVIQNDAEGSLAIQAIENFALTCKSMGEWMLAIEAYQMLIERFGTPKIKPHTLFEISFCYYRDKKYQKAIELFEEILPKISKRKMKAEIYYWIGESYFGLEKYEKSIESFLKIVYSYADFPEWDVNANIKIAISYEKLYKLPKAKYFYNNVITKYGLESKWGKEAKRLLDALP